MTVDTFYITRHVRALVRTSAAGTALRAALQITIPCLRHRAAPVYFILCFSRALISFAKFSSWLAFMTRSSLGDRYLTSTWQIRPRTRPYQTCIGIFSRIILGVTHKPDHGCAFVACPDAGEGYFPSGRLNSTTRVRSNAGKSFYPILKHTLVSSFMRAECRTQSMH